MLFLLLSNTVGASASSTGDPTVIVSNYVGLYTTLEKAKDGDVIGIKGVITVPNPDTLNYASVTLKRMETGAKIIFTDTYGYGGSSTVKMIEFDGNSSTIGGREPFVVVAGNAHFSMCEFTNCFYEGGNGGAVYVAFGEARFSSCRFIDNCADYGAGIYNGGTLTVDSCTFKGNWAEEFGGAIYNAGTLTIKDTEIKENTARMGGGIYSNASTEIYNSLIWRNTASIHGADIANEGSLSNYTTEEQYNSLLNYYKLCYAGWADDLNTNIGGIGDYRKFLTTDEAPKEPEPVDPTPTEPPVEDPEEPIEPDTPADEDNTDPTEPEEPDEKDDTGEKDPPITPEDPTTPDEEGDPTDPSTNPDPDSGEPTDTDPNPSTPSDNKQGDTIDNSTTDNSATDNSTVDNSITDNSVVDNSVTDNSTHHTENNSKSESTTDNSKHSSTTDNSSQTSNTSTDNSRSQSSKTENSNNTTTYNYYRTEQDKSPVVTSQSPIQPITVNVTVPQEKGVNTASQEPTEAIQTISQNIHIDAEGVNVKYEYTADGISISISPYKATESPIEADMVLTSLSTVTTPQEPTESPNNWMDYVSMILLAILVLGELRDRLGLEKERKKI